MTSLASVDASITSPAEDKNFASRPAAPESPDFRCGLFDCMGQLSLQRQHERLVVALAVASERMTASWSFCI
jgi:hypothetical protein